MVTLFEGGGVASALSRETEFIFVSHVTSHLIPEGLVYLNMFVSPSALELNLKTSQFKPINYKKHMDRAVLC